MTIPLCPNTSTMLVVWFFGVPHQHIYNIPLSWYNVNKFFEPFGSCLYIIYKAFVIQLLLSCFMFLSRLARAHQHTQIVA